MLQNIRDKLQGTLAKIVVGLIALPFVVFGVESLFAPSSTVHVAEVGDVKIEEVDLARALMQHKNRLLAQFGDQLDPKMLDDSVLRAPVLEQLIDRTLLQSYAQDNGMSISARLVDDTILATEDFQENGRFSADIYTRLLASNNWTPAQYKQLLEEQMLLGQVAGGVVDTAFVTQAELDQIAALMGEKRDFRYAILPRAEVLKALNITDADVQAVYDSRPDGFMSQETLSVEYVQLKKQDLAKPVSDDEVRAQYEQELATREQKIERQAAHIFLAVKSESDEAAVMQRLKTIEERLGKGEDFAAVAKEASEDVGSSRKGGVLGFSAGDTFPPAIEKALESLQPGQVSGPVRSDRGVHLVKLLNVRDGGEAPTLEASRARITQELQERAAAAAYVTALENLADLAFSSGDLNAVVKGFKDASLSIQTTAPFTREQGSDVASLAKVREAAFSDEVLKDGQNSAVIELEDGSAVVLRVHKHAPAARKPLQEVAAAIRQELTDQRAREALARQSAELVEQLKQNPEASPAGISWQDAKGLARGTPFVDAAIQQQVFTLARPVEGKPVYGAVDTLSGDRAVVIVTGAELGSWSALSEAEQQSLRTLMRNNQGNRELLALRESIRAATEIKKY